MTYYKQHNISPSLARKPLITDTVSVNRRIHFAQIAQVLNMPIEEIRTFNPQFRADVIPGDNHPYTLVLPSQQIYSFIMSEDSIENYRNDLYAHREVVEPGGQVSTAEEYVSGRKGLDDIRTINHKVGRGETLASIAAKYDMSTQDLMALNNMNSERVRRGDNLKVKAPMTNNASADNEDIIPVSSDTSVSTDDLALNNTPQGSEQEQFDEVKDIERQAAAKAPYKGSYTAKSDEQINKSTASPKASVKNDEQTTRQRASRANTDNWRKRNEHYTGSKDNSRHKRDDKSRKKEDTTHSSTSRRHGKKSSKPQQPTEVTVQKGESLTKIAEKTGLSVKDLERANGIENGNKIKAGEKIKIPTKAEAKQAAAAEKKANSKSNKKGSKSGSKASKNSSSSKSSKSGSSGKSSKKSKKK
jgi:LysM repeat protein